MAGIRCHPGAGVGIISTSNSRSLQVPRCCSNSSDNSKKPTPQFLKLVINGATEFLRLFTSSSNRPNAINMEQKDEFPISGIDDVISILKSDYENAYFVTGLFTRGIYADDCLFEDPTIKFRGTDLYSRNLQILVPFFDRPSILLKNIKKGVKSETNFVLADWRLRTYLKLPWGPLIAIDGSTIYDLDDKFKIVKHSESWSVSALEAVGQIFTPTFGNPDG